VKVSFTCGSQTISYDNSKCKSSTYACSCDRRSCTWTVVCDGEIVEGTAPQAKPGNGGGTKPLPPGVFSVVVRGRLSDAAKILERRWDRPIVVPTRIRSERMQRRLRGTPDEIVEALGLRFR
jgi:hypothetical protein